jgi:type I restriction enzyme R subunit
MVVFNGAVRERLLRFSASASITFSSMTSEGAASEKIHAQLVAPGWAVQKYKILELSVECGLALREVPLASGNCDHLLFVDRMSVGAIDAGERGTMLSAVADLSRPCCENLPHILAAR